MKVPKYIKQKMHRVARLTCLARYEMMKVEEWLQEHDIETDYGSSMRCGDGNSLEELEYGNDITDSLCSKIEKELYR